ncbi:MAG: DUF5930 domain-containing protein [Roseovarius sp.]|nr:DUF5930 domain-containing protein [Roseovarius sp.]MCY4208130.1 DUF5930 domain-containing protein [Roseovarius sp.]MCY4292133.1 DUF5930 domain-containing protein [Roseovarius sp.]
MKAAKHLRRHLERHFPERRVFLRTDTDTRYLCLGTWAQIMILSGVSVLLGWTIIATAILAMDSIGSGNFREQSKRERELSDARLKNATEERDASAAQLHDSQERFKLALDQISLMHGKMLEAEKRKRELEIERDALQSALRRTIADRNKFAQMNADSIGSPDATGGTTDDSLVNYLTRALSDTVLERDRLIERSKAARKEINDITAEIRLIKDRNAQIFTQLEDAMLVSVEPLEKIFSRAGISIDNLLKTVKAGYSGIGGPFMPVVFEHEEEVYDSTTSRTNQLLEKMDQLNLYNIAFDLTPFAHPIRNKYRFTSPYGMRRGRMHNGADFASRHGTPIYATADGIVLETGWYGGYGKMVKLKHEFGFETRYAHLSKIRVKPGEKISRGQIIGDMGNTGRSTGTHLHYEIRVNGTPVNPMNFIKAGRDVF